MIFYLGLVLSSTIALSYATVGGQYSVNVHFVPPLVTAPCSIAQFWSPSNVTCALCFCMTGSLSRCIPQPGCNPQTQNSNTTTTTMSPSNTTESSTTENPGDSSTMPDENAPPSMNPNSPASGTPAESPPETPEGTPTAAPANPDETPGAAAEKNGSGAGSKVRGAKPGKSRRRRHSGN
ncbi:unnamed protein product [Orchesella dallaii]|uniref:Uncharacterized protein n=1 Tax=Orchesella dallaii TaxID=48710 RepID=A0ABP1QXL0_9HEXA